MITEGDRLRLIRFRDDCLRTGGLSVYIAELFDALANDDLVAAQTAAAYYVTDYTEVRKEQARALAHMRRAQEARRPV